MDKNWLQCSSTSKETFFRCISFWLQNLKLNFITSLWPLTAVLVSTSYFDFTGCSTLLKDLDLWHQIPSHISWVGLGNDATIFAHGYITFSVDTAFRVEMALLTVSKLLSERGWLHLACETTMQWEKPTTFQVKYIHVHTEDELQSSR